MIKCTTEYRYEYFSMSPVSLHYGMAWLTPAFCLEHVKIPCGTHMYIPSGLAAKMSPTTSKSGHKWLRCTLFYKITLESCTQNL
jgi:hypothetical protein